MSRIRWSPVLYQQSQTRVSLIAGRAVLVLFVVGLFCGLSGCSADGMLELAGEVTLDGAPIDQGTISFFPADNKGASAEAVIAEGRYSVSLPRGAKRVVIRGYKKVGERFPWGKDNPPAPILEEIVPKSFNDESSLTFDAEENRQDADFLLTSS